MKHIQFFGDSGVCSKWLPYAKKKMDFLTRQYHQKNWTWEVSIGGEVQISLERNGEIQYVRIRATTGGYEFTTTFPRPGPGFNEDLPNVKFGVARPYADPDDPELLPRRLFQRNSEFLPIDLEADTLADQKDRWLFAGNWPLIYEYGAQSTYTMMDWFRIPLPDGEDESEKQAEVDRRREKGFSGCRRIITTTGDGGRYKTQGFQDSLLSYLWNFAGVYWVYRAFKGWTIVHKRGGKSKILNVGFEVMTAALQGEFVIGAIGRENNYMDNPPTGNDRATWGGERYRFIVHDPVADQTYEYDLRDSRPPQDAVGFFFNRARWHWRGDGRRAISIQTDYYANNFSGLFGWPPEDAIYGPPVTRTWFHEIDFEVVRSNPDEPESPPAMSHQTTLMSSDHTDRWRAAAVDYDLFDGRVRRCLMLEPWIGPAYERTPIGIYDDSFRRRNRSLLVYAHICRLNDDGTVSEPEQSFPVYHAPWIPMNTPAYEGGLVTDEYGNTNNGFAPNSTGVVTNASGFKERWGYSCLTSQIAALDLRAQAIAIFTQQQNEIITIGETGTGYAESYTFSHNKRWRIWGEPEWRQYEWCDDAGLPYNPGTDPLVALQVPPADYKRYKEGSTPLHDTGGFGGPEDVVEPNRYRNRYYEEEIQPVFAKVFEPYWDIGAPTQLYHGFRIHPKKHVALWVKQAGTWTVKQCPEIFFRVLDPSPGARKFLNFDHVEYREKNGYLIQTTHYELFNTARETEHEPGDGDVWAIAANGLWNI